VVVVSGGECGVEIVPNRWQSSSTIAIDDGDTYFEAARPRLPPLPPFPLVFVTWSSRSAHSWAAAASSLSSSSSLSFCAPRRLRFTGCLSAFDAWRFCDSAGAAFFGLAGIRRAVGRLNEVWRQWEVVGGSGRW
jgi:hypothetical protein